MTMDDKTQLIPAIQDYELLDIIGQGGIAQILNKPESKGLWQGLVTKIKGLTQ
jgi:hypothetical protein